MYILLRVSIFLHVLAPGASVRVRVVCLCARALVWVWVWVCVSVRENVCAHTHIDTFVAHIFCVYVYV